jgi:hypothetical protein
VATFSLNKYLFTKVDQELLQYRIDDPEPVKKYKFNVYILSAITTFDDRHVFVGLQGGFLHQICIESQIVTKHYGQIHDESIDSMAVTRDNIFLITWGADRRVKKIPVTTQQVIREFGNICQSCIQIIKLAPGDQSLFVYNGICSLKLINLKDGKTIKDLGRVQVDSCASYWQQMEVTRCGGICSPVLMEVNSSNGVSEIELWCKTLASYLIQSRLCVFKGVFF